MQTIFKKSGLFFLILAISLLTFAGAVFAEETENSSEMTLDEIIASYAGKKVSIIGDSISTYSGISNDATTNSTIGNNAYYYSTSFGVNNTWWQQVINALGMERLVNNSWSGSTVLKDNKGTESAMYKTRCVNLHNDITGEKPDIIFVFGGTNDFTHYQSTLGTAAAIDYAALITENEDGTFTYATPATMLEAYAIMLHKMQTAYPDAEIFCANLLLRRDPVLEGKKDAGQPTEFNVELGKVIEKMGARLVDFEGCGLESTPEVYDMYVTDQNVHPGARGMDLMSAAVLTEMLGVDCHPIIFDNLGTARSNTAFYAINGSSYESDITLKSAYEDLTVKVTMGGEDVTSTVYTDGKVNIPSVTGHVVIKATGKAEYLSHLQTIEGDICSKSNLWTKLTPEKSYFDGSDWNTKYYSVTFPVNAGDQLFATSFGASGTNGNSNTSGTRITYFYSDGTLKSISPANVYSEFNANGYVTVPENAVAVNVPMWTNSSSYKLNILNKEHIYEAGTAEGGYAAYICKVCGAEGERIEDFVFDGAVTLEGFSIKLKSTETAVNGLRSISTFDWNKNATYEAGGYDLLEFGAIALSRAQYEATEGNFTIDTETGKLSGANGAVIPVWKNGGYVGSTLEVNEDTTMYALTLVNYEAYHADDVYFAAYSVYSREGEEEPIVTIAGYSDDDNKFANLYQLTLDMYVNGAINSSNTDDTAVWDTLLTGVVTLTSSQYGTGATDMDGNAFGDSFIFKEVSNMKTSGNENANIKITLFNDYKTGEYVAIWRGTGTVAASSQEAGSQLWYNTDRTKMSHPKLTQATSKKITTFVFDDGITGIASNSYAMRGVYCKTYVCAGTFKTIGNNVFYQNNALTSVYQAKANGYMQDNEIGLVDISFITSLGTTNLFYKMATSCEFSKIHFPAKLTTTYIGAGAVSRTDNTRYKNLVKVWCGNTAEPEAGVIDLTGFTNVTAIYGSCFAAMSSSLDSYICILPDGCRLSRSSSNNAFYTLNVTEIRQATYNANVVTDIAAHKHGLASKVKYCDLSGKEHTVPAT
ncbi:MAG: hypothetical protein IKJ91_12605 [Clostridia bacterium]|nr:hypothetical protein [Clostridia bacterium]